MRPSSVDFYFLKYLTTHTRKNKFPIPAILLEMARQTHHHLIFFFFCWFCYVVYLIYKLILLWLWVGWVLSSLLYYCTAHHGTGMGFAIYSILLSWVNTSNGEIDVF